MFSFDASNRRKEEERLRNESRLPPGQSLTLKFPVLHYGPVPPFNPATWDFRVWGEVKMSPAGPGTISTACRARASPSTCTA